VETAGQTFETARYAPVDKAVHKPCVCCEQFWINRQIARAASGGHSARWRIMPSARCAAGPRRRAVKAAARF